MEQVKAQQHTTFDTLKSQFGYTNRMQAPVVEKAVVSVGTGSLHDAGKEDVIKDRLARITGQKPAARGARKSIASFRVRAGNIVGYQVTLRGARLYDFLEKLLRVALPRTRDFQGISVRAIDEMGNITIGIRDHTIFPETSDEELKDVFGMAITITTTAGSKAEAYAFLRHIGVPFRDELS